MWTRKPIQVLKTIYQLHKDIIKKCKLCHWNRPHAIKCWGFCWLQDCLKMFLWNPMYIYLCSNSNFFHLSLFWCLLWQLLYILSTCVISNDCIYIRVIFKGVWDKLKLKKKFLHDFKKMSLISINNKILMLCVFSCSCLYLFLLGSNVWWNNLK